MLLGMGMEHQLVAIILLATFTLGLEQQCQGMAQQAPKEARNLGQSPPLNSQLLTPVSTVVG